ncbi:MAG: hypothetical protein ACLUVC_03460 [Longibaculum sp.]
MDKVKTLGICIGCLTFMFEAIYTYQFSFIGTPAFLAFCILFIGLIYFIDSWFYYIWGLFTGMVIFCSLIYAVFNQSQNMPAFIFDAILSLFFMIYFGFKVYKRWQCSK